MLRSCESQYIRLCQQNGNQIHPSLVLTTLESTCLMDNRWPWKRTKSNCQELRSSILKTGREIILAIRLFSKVSCTIWFKIKTNPAFRLRQIKGRLLNGSWNLKTNQISGQLKGVRTVITLWALMSRVLISSINPLMSCRLCPEYLDSASPTIRQDLSYSLVRQRQEPFMIPKLL